jgi:hypothetical protein
MASRVAVGFAVVLAAGACWGCGDATPGAIAGESSSSADGDSGTTSSGTVASATDGSAGTTTGGEPADSSTGRPTTSDDTGDFAIDCHTALVDGALALECNLPAALAACLELAGAPCEDADGDGLTDAWEDLALERLRPLRRLDEAESLVDDPDAVLGDVGRVFGVGDRVRMFVMLGYSTDYGSCGGFTSHNGDSERVALDLAAHPEGGPGGVIVAQAYTAAHEGTINDHSRRFGSDELGLLTHDADPESGEPRWVVFPSADKHGTYASLGICEGISILPCVDEDCGPDDVDDPSVFDRLPAVVNAGEPTSPRVTSLDALGFVGDDAWAEQDFCGGLGGDACSAPVREKLVMDPF